MLLGRIYSLRGSKTKLETSEFKHVGFPPALNWAKSGTDFCLGFGNCPSLITILILLCFYLKLLDGSVENSGNIMRASDSTHIAKCVFMYPLIGTLFIHLLSFMPLPRFLQNIIILSNHNFCIPDLSGSIVAELSYFKARLTNKYFIVLIPYSPFQVLVVSNKVRNRDRNWTGLAWGICWRFEQLE